MTVIEILDKLEMFKKTIRNDGLSRTDVIEIEDTFGDIITKRYNINIFTVARTTQMTNEVLKILTSMENTFKKDFFETFIDDFENKVTDLKEHRKMFLERKELVEKIIDSSDFYPKDFIAFTETGAVKLAKLSIREVLIDYKEDFSQGDPVIEDLIELYKEQPVSEVPSSDIKLYRVLDTIKNLINNENYPDTQINNLEDFVVNIFKTNPDVLFTHLKSDLSRKIYKSLKDFKPFRIPDEHDIIQNGELLLEIVARAIKIRQR